MTPDADLTLVREVGGLETLIAEPLSDSRQGLNTQFSLADLLPQSVYSRLVGHEDLNDAVCVSADPTIRRLGSPKIWVQGRPGVRSYRIDAGRIYGGKRFE